MSLPGMMTGQIIAGADPVQAVRYQIVVMFMIAAVVGLATFIALELITRRAKFEAHRTRRAQLAARRLLRDLAQDAVGPVDERLAHHRADEAHAFKLDLVAGSSVVGSKGLSNWLGVSAKLSARRRWSAR